VALLQPAPRQALACATIEEMAICPDASKGVVRATERPKREANAMLSNINLRAVLTH
jgi:hypothetical protein